MVSGIVWVRPRVSFRVMVMVDTTRPSVRVRILGLGVR
jgi:hypothetical protein